MLAKENQSQPAVDNRRVWYFRPTLRYTEMLLFYEYGHAIGFPGLCFYLDYARDEQALSGKADF